MTAVKGAYTKADLTGLKPRHKSFVGIDSDGCVFPTMEIKQKKCFHTLIISHWHLEAVGKYVRECAEFLNLCSKWRGTNRFPGLIMTMDLLRERPEVKAAGVKVPELRSLRAFIDSGRPLGNPELAKCATETGDPEIASVLQWSQDINALVAETIGSVPPFKGVLDSLKKIQANSDAICVSQTPTEALVREWDENNLRQYVVVIAGQELGTKTEHIAMATGGRYNPDKILMIGDALGDLKAARGNHALFFPVNPGHEEASWDRFYREGYDRFLDGTYGGDYERKLVEEFEGLLPDTPPWKT